MGKMLNVLLIIFLAEISIALFITGCANPESTICVEGEEKTSLFLWLLSPQDWTEASLLELIKVNIFLIGGLTAITVGTLWMKSDFLVYAGITATLFTFGQSLFRLWHTMGQVPFFSGIGEIMATILMGGIFIYVLITMLDFARGRD